MDSDITRQYINAPGPGPGGAGHLHREHHDHARLWPLGNSIMSTLRMLFRPHEMISTDMRLAEAGKVVQMEKIVASAGGSG